MMVKDDHRSGIVLDVDSAAGIVRVSGPDLPEVVFRRTGDVTNKHLPLGTRRAENLAVTVDGRPAALDLPRGGLRRASRRVTVSLAGSHYEMRPAGDDNNTFSRRTDSGGTVALGEFFTNEDSVTALWADVPDPLTTALGYAIAGAFGVGAMSMASIVFHSWVGTSYS